MNKRIRIFILWFILLSLTVSAQNLIFKSSFEEIDEINFPPEILSSPVNTVIVETLYSYPVVAIDLNGDILSYSTTDQPAGMVINIFSGNITWVPTSTGIFSVTVEVTDGLGSADSQSFDIEVIDSSSTDIPPHPASVAPELDEGEATVIGLDTAFLYEGDDPIQTGVAPETIDPVMATVLRGRVTKRDGSRLSGVMISILGIPMYGSTLTRFDGEFDLVVNGGQIFTVNYEKDGYLPVQRDIPTSWQEYGWLPEVVMIPLDPNVTEIDLTNPAPLQLVIGSSESDADGTRQAVLMIPAGTTANMLMPDDALIPISTLNIRATEYTIGENGPETMPGELPPTSGYTYAVELSVDEAIAAGADEVQFSQSLPFYVDNFIGFPVGGIAPAGSYDRQTGNWLASDNGLVIEVVGIDGSRAELDVDGDGVTDSGNSLTDLGITAAELEALAGLYSPGQKLWRVPISHFSPLDINWPPNPPPYAIAPPPAPTETPGPDDPCKEKGSIIDCHNQTVREKADVVGTPFSLNFWSTLVGSQSIDIPLSTSNPAILNALSITLDVTIAGRKFEYSFAAQPSLMFRFDWDGMDNYNRKVQGQIPIHVNVQNVWHAVYTEPQESINSFARVSISEQLDVTGARTAFTAVFRSFWTRLLGALDLRGTHTLGGWSLDPHHFYDPGGQTLYLGSGEKRSSSANFGLLVIKPVAGNGLSAGNGDDNPAIEEGFNTISDIEVFPDGSFLIAELNRIRKVGTNGIITTIAGTGVSGYSGDGELAITAKLSGVRGIDLGPDGSIYIADRLNHRIRKVDPAGIITTIAGDGNNFFAPGADDVPALETQVTNPEDVVVAPDGGLYLVEPSWCRIRRVDPNGIISTFAGADDQCFSDLGDGGPALDASLQSLRHITLDANGAFYLISGARIRRIGPDGIINTVAGGGAGFRDDGELATGALFSDTSMRGLVVDKGGVVYFGNEGKVRTVSVSGILGTLAGTGLAGQLGDGNEGLARAANMGGIRGLTRGPQGDFYVAEHTPTLTVGIVRRITSNLPGFSAADIAIASESGNELYVFSSGGRHLRTVNTLTGAELYNFNYDGEDRLAEIVDGDGNVTTIERDIDGNASAIVAPGGQATALAINPDGYLQSITNPAGEKSSMTYTGDGLLETFTDPLGNTATKSYGEDFRLLESNDGSGGSLTFSRVGTSTQYTVTKTTATGKVSTYQMEYLPSGSTRSTVTNSDGDQIVVQDGADGVSTTTLSDGREVRQVYGPDPRFGMQSPLLESLLVTHPAPSILSNEVTQSRSVTLTDPLNPLSLLTLEDTLSLNGRIFTDHYDALTRTFTKTSPDGHQVVSVLDLLGRINSTVPAVGLDQITYTYDEQGRLEQRSQGTQTETLAYDLKNRVISRTDAANNITLYEYDDADRVIKMTKSGGQVLNYQYDANGNRTSLQMPSTNTHAMAFARGDLRTAYTPPGNESFVRTYDADRQIISDTLPGGRTVLNNFDSNRRWTGLDYEEASVTYSYDGTTDRLSSLVRTAVSIGDAQQTDYLYDGKLVTRAIWSGATSGVYRYSYDDNYFFTQIRLDSGSDTVITPVSWNDDGYPVTFGPFTMTRGGPGGALSQISDADLELVLQYDTLGRVQSRSTTVNALAAYNYTLTRNNIGRIVQKDETLAGVNHVYIYTYDDNGQLIDVTRDATLVEHYTYDVNGNRDSTLSGLASYDGQDRLMSNEGVSYTFDDDGYLSARETETYEYSARGELLRAVLPGPSEITWSYDGLRRRVARMDASGTTEYLYGHPWDPLLVTAVRASNGVLTNYYYDDDAVLFALERSGNRYYVGTDQVATPRVVTDSFGVVVKMLEYDSFGKQLSDSDPSFELHIGYAGGLEDTDIGLVHFGFRDYHQETARWTARDPILYDAGQANLYVYIGNNPISQRDPTGLWCVGVSAYHGVGGGGELCCKNGNCSVCSEGGFGRGGGVDAGAGEPKEDGNTFFLEGGAGCGPLGAGFSCDVGGKCGPTCSNKGGLGPFSLSDSGDVGVGHGESDLSDLGGKRMKESGAKCGFNFKGGLRGCGSW